MSTNQNTGNHSQTSFIDGYGMKILRNLRRIMRAVDMHSRRLQMQYQVTAPQMICLVALEHGGPMTLTELARQVSLSPSTLTGILDRLEQKALVLRLRRETDRRKVTLVLTEKGVQITKEAPALLQDKLSQAVAALPELEQAAIALSLERLVALMDLEKLDASPLLIPGTYIGDETLSSGDQYDNSVQQGTMEPNH